ncbi:Small-conductance mechanosensitive channel [Halalkaliarchaeum sp. AArc-CO]|uniref:mechanosensitive ion channel family protein n=1 Tax=unclassified Halalkaliarchaeum TaxID=2678344 RepID=UPI00217EF4E7|nr:MULTISPECIES: mechanosensitive ion channel family protein [unclassified Halalkaliarchaeum]MDR5672257.1 mechanosensitive ion channel family protein [Halalkaliarchaeum sp. AArc-GB]UWG50127.1 Small-conductance mechanosensitive channel [Halalkaliarchaeum sp. AArc-CO]
MSVGQTPLQWEVVSTVPTRLWVAAGVLLLGLVLAILAGRLNRRLLVRAGVPETIEGTAFERTAREFGTSTVDLVAKLTFYFIAAIALLAALTVAELQYVDIFWSGVAVLLPQFFVAVFILLVGIVIGDKVELLIAERLKGVKLPEINVVPVVANYSIVFVAILLALAQVGVATLVLVVLMGMYAFALIVFTAIATKDLLASGAAGVYLLLAQPYSIGDEVKVGGQRGIVQEVNLLVTHIETDGEEHIVPNHSVFRDGIVRIRR